MLRCTLLSRRCLPWQVPVSMDVQHCGKSMMQWTLLCQDAAMGRVFHLKFPLRSLCSKVGTSVTLWCYGFCYNERERPWSSSIIKFPFRSMSSKVRTSLCMHASSYWPSYDSSRFDRCTAKWEFPCASIVLILDHTMLMCTLLSRRCLPWQVPVYCGNSMMQWTLLHQESAMGRVFHLKFPLRSLCNKVGTSVTLWCYG